MIIYALLKTFTALGFYVNIDTKGVKLQQVEFLATFDLVLKMFFTFYRHKDWYVLTNSMTFAKTFK